MFDFNTMTWAVVARMRANKEDTEFYRTAFSLMFQTCHTDFPQFKIESSLNGIIVDWSDTETKGLREAVGEELADCYCWGAMYTGLGRINLLLTGSIAAFKSVTENLQLKHSVLLQSW